MKTIISLEDVWKIYKMGDVEVQVLRGLTLKIWKHEFAAVMGPSGSGKSTAMNMIGCLDVPTRGKVILEEHDISKLGESRLAQIRGKKIGFVFQKFNLISSFTALENVMLPMIFQNVKTEERKERATKLLEIVGLGKRVSHRPTQLSGGEQQRVAIARALANEPEVLLADEPTGNLDSKTGEDIMKMLKEMHKKNRTTIVVVTHDMGIARAAQRVVYLKDGRIVPKHEFINPKKK